MELPSGWTKSKFSELAVLQRGKFSARPRNDPKFYGGEMPFVQTGDVRAAHVTLNKFSQTLNERGIAVSKVFPKGSLLFTIAANIADVAFLGMDAACPDSLVAILPHDHVDPRWLLHQVEAYQPKFEAAATQNAQLNINLDKLNPFELPCPPLAEQQAIAEALSDADGVVEGLERLIEKKQRIKQGAMQDLLTAKRRLPGFSGEWVTKPLRDLCSQIQDGTHFTPTYVDMGTPFYSVENVTARNFDVCKFVTPTAHAALAKRCLPKRGDILMTRIGSIGDTYLVDWDYEASIYVSLCLLRPSPSIDASYLYAYSRSSMFVKGVEDRSLPNAIPKKINLGDIADVEISMPIDPSEQSAIADMLSDMDAEITALEARLQKARAIKEGMMQNLLTGRIRLV